MKCREVKSLEQAEQELEHALARAARVKMDKGEWRELFSPVERALDKVRDALSDGRCWDARL